MPETGGELNRFIMGMVVTGLGDLTKVRADLTAIESIGNRISGKPIQIGTAAAAAGAGGRGGGVTPVIAPMGGAGRQPKPPKLPKETGEKAYFNQADFSTVARRVFMWGTATMVIYRTIRAVNEAVQSTQALGMEMVQLEKVMPSETNFRRIREGFFGISKTYGESILEVIRVGKLFAQTGLKEEEVLKMTSAAMLGVNSANLAAQESVEFLISAQRAYNIEIEKTPLLLDKIMRVQAHYAIEAKELAVAFQRGASTFKLMGLSPDILFGYVTAVKEVTREAPETIIRGLRTTLMRSMKPEAIEAFRGIGITGIGKGKTIFDAYTELAEKMRRGEISPERFRELANSIVGDVRMMRHFLALMDNYDRALAATKESQEAYGDAQKAANKQLDQWAKKVQIAQQYWKEFSTLFVEDTIQPTLEILVSLIGQLGIGLTKLQKTEIGKDMFGGLLGLGASVGIFKLLDLLTGKKLTTGLKALKGLSVGSAAGAVGGAVGGFALKAAPWIAIAATIAHIIRKFMEWKKEQALFNVEFKETIDLTSIATKEFVEYFGTIDSGIEKTTQMARAIIEWQNAGKQIKTVDDLANAMKSYGMEIEDVTKLQDIFTASQRFYRNEIYGNIERLKEHFAGLATSMGNIFEKTGRGGYWNNIVSKFNMFKLPDFLGKIFPKFNFAEELANNLLGELRKADKKLANKVVSIAADEGWSTAQVVGSLLEPAGLGKDLGLGEKNVEKMKDAAYEYIKNAILTRSEFKKFRSEIGVMAEDPSKRSAQIVDEITRKVLDDLVPAMARAEMGAEKWAEYQAIVTTQIQGLGKAGSFIDDIIFRIGKLNDELFNTIVAFHTQKREILATSEVMKSLGMGYNKLGTEIDLYVETLTKLSTLDFSNEKEIRKVRNALDLTKNISREQLKAMESVFRDAGEKIYTSYQETMERLEFSGYATGAVEEARQSLQETLGQLEAENWRSIYERFGTQDRPELAKLLIDTMGFSKKKIDKLLNESADHFINSVRDIYTKKAKELSLQRLSMELEKGTAQFNLEVNIKNLEKVKELRDIAKEFDLSLGKFALKDELAVLADMYSIEKSYLEKRKERGEFSRQDGAFIKEAYELEKQAIKQKYGMLEIEAKINEERRKARIVAEQAKMAYELNIDRELGLLDITKERLEMQYEIRSIYREDNKNVQYENLADRLQTNRELSEVELAYLQTRRERGDLEREYGLLADSQFRKEQQEIEQKYKLLDVETQLNYERELAIENMQRMRMAKEFDLSAQLFGFTMARESIPKQYEFKRTLSGKGFQTIAQDYKDGIEQAEKLYEKEIEILDTRMKSGEFQHLYHNLATEHYRKEKQQLEQNLALQRQRVEEERNLAHARMIAERNRFQDEYILRGFEFGGELAKLNIGLARDKKIIAREGMPGAIQANLKYTITAYREMKKVESDLLDLRWESGDYQKKYTELAEVNYQAEKQALEQQYIRLETEARINAVKEERQLIVRRELMDTERYWKGREFDIQRPLNEIRFGGEIREMFRQGSASEDLKNYKDKLFISKQLFETELKFLEAKKEEGYYEALYVDYAKENYEREKQELRQKYVQQRAEVGYDYRRRAVERLVRRQDLDRQASLQALQFGVDVTKTLAQYDFNRLVAARGMETPGVRLANLKDELNMVREQRIVETAMLEARWKSGEFYKEDSEFAKENYEIAVDTLDNKYKELDLETRINYALEAHSTYAQSYLQNVQDVKSVIADTLSDLGMWYDMLYDEEGIMSRKGPLLELLGGVGRIYSRNIAAQFSDALMGMFNTEKLGNILAGGNFKLRAYAEGGEIMMKQARIDILAGKDILGNSQLRIGQQQLDVQKDILIAIRSQGSEYPKMTGMDKVPGKWGYGTKNGTGYFSYADYDTMLNEMHPIPPGLGGGTANISPSRRDWLVEQQRKDRDFVGPLPPVDFYTNEATQKEKQKEKWGSVAAQAGMIGGQLIGAKMKDSQSEWVSTGSQLLSLAASAANLHPLGILAAGLVGGILGGLIKDDQAAEDLHEIRINTNTLKELNNQLINAPATFAMPVTQGFFGGQSRGGSTSPPITVNVTVDTKGNVKEYEAYYENSQNRSGSKYNQFG